MIDQDTNTAISEEEKSINILNTHYQRFSEIASVALKIKEDIEICTSPNVRPHKTKLISIQKDLVELYRLSEFLHNNNGFNVMMCVADTLEKDEKEKNIAYVVTKYFEMDFDSELVSSGMAENLSDILSLDMAKNIDHKEKIDKELFSYVKILSNIFPTSSFFSKLKDHPLFEFGEVKDQAVKAITNYTRKCEQLQINNTVN